MAAFSIRIESEQPAIGRIRVGDFTESFELDRVHWTCSDYRRSWATALKRLLDGSRPAVALATWSRPAPSLGIQRAWILFREGARVLVQERIFVPGEHAALFDEDGLASTIGPRKEVNEDGARISQWETTTDALESFLQHDGDTRLG